MKHLLVVATLVGLLMAGCSTPTRSSPGSGFPATSISMAVPESENYTGLFVEGAVMGGGKELTLHATARNDGNRTYRVETTCTQPWSEQLFRNGERIQIREPTFHCDAFILRDFPPGEVIPQDLTWNGTRWDDRSRQYVRADAGNYVWRARFIAYPEADGNLKLSEMDFSIKLV